VIERVVPLPALAATEKLAQEIAPLLKKGDALLLRGPLGAGKTTFARALLHALGHADDVPSPTFTLVQSYDLPGLRLAHFDLYRLNAPEEIEEIGLFEALAEGAALIEWPEKAEAFLPKRRYEIVFSGEDDERQATVKGFEKR
jgi:tRNA threonylcarbamoyl adenosine modification protein YjeE